MSARNDGQQVALDGTDGRRMVAVERKSLQDARALLSWLIRKTSDDKPGPNPTSVATSINALAAALDRDDLPGEQVAEFGGGDDV